MKSSRSRCIASGSWAAVRIRERKISVNPGSSHWSSIASISARPRRSIGAAEASRTRLASRGGGSSAAANRPAFPVK